MIGRQPSDHDSHDSSGAGSSGRSPRGDLFDDIFHSRPITTPGLAPSAPTPGGQPPATQPPVASEKRSAAGPAGQGGETRPTDGYLAPPPRSAGRQLVPPALRTPTTVKQTGLSLMHLCDLVLKQLYMQRSMLGIDIARQSRLPFTVIDEALRYLKNEKCIEVSSGDVIGSASFAFNLTELGRTRAREAFEHCRYVGPAPVSLEDYYEQSRHQTVSGIRCFPEALEQAFRTLIIRRGLLEELGPAVCSGRSIFLYGPPGNGKTQIAKGLGSFLNEHGGEIFVPYAIHAEGGIVTVFDPTIHQVVEESNGETVDPAAGAKRGSSDPGGDLRWKRVRRPVVITGGELTLEMLDLRYNKSSNYYTAPLHIKANGGVFLIDDFGRQIVSPRDLLNRWILPLEERIDFLTLATGKKFSVPFEQLIIFSTNLNPRELVDEAFLRRIRHIIQIGRPERPVFEALFRLYCEQPALPSRPDVVDFLYANYYDNGKPPRSSDPRDLLEIAQSICRFRGQETALTPDLVSEAARRFFCQV